MSEITLVQNPNFPLNWFNTKTAKEGDILRVTSPIDSSQSAFFKLTYHNGLVPRQVNVIWNNAGTIFNLAYSDHYEILNDSAISHRDNDFSIVSKTDGTLESGEWKQQ